MQELLTELAASVEALQGDNNRLLASLKGGRPQRLCDAAAGAGTACAEARPAVAAERAMTRLAFCPRPHSCAAAEVTQWWRDITIENCELRSQIALLQAGGGAGANGASDGSDGSHSTGSGAGRSDMGSPIAGGLGGGWDQQLLSPGWPSPMLM